MIRVYAGAWPGVRRAGLPRLSGGADAGPGAAQRRRLIHYGLIRQHGGQTRRTSGVSCPVRPFVKLWRRCGSFRSLRSVMAMGRCLPRAWNGSWNGAPDNPSAAGAVSAMTCAIGAASVHGVRGRASCKRQVSGSIPLTGSQVREGVYPL